MAPVHQAHLSSSAWAGKLHYCQFSITNIAAVVVVIIIILLVSVSVTTVNVTIVRVVTFSR